MTIGRRQKTYGHYWQQAEQGDEAARLKCHQDKHSVQIKQSSSPKTLSSGWTILQEVLIDDSIGWQAWEQQQIRKCSDVEYDEGTSDT